MQICIAEVGTNMYITVDSKHWFVIGIVQYFPV